MTITDILLVFLAVILLALIIAFGYYVLWPLLTMWTNK